MRRAATEAPKRSLLRARAGTQWRTRRRRVASKEPTAAPSHIEAGGWPQRTCDEDQAAGSAGCRLARGERVRSRPADDHTADIRHRPVEMCRASERMEVR